VQLEQSKTENKNLQVDLDSDAARQPLEDLQSRFPQIETDKANLEIDRVNSSQRRILNQSQCHQSLRENDRLQTKLKTELQERASVQLHMRRMTDGFEQASKESVVALQSYSRNKYIPSTCSPRSVLRTRNCALDLQHQLEEKTR
jgi:hypothetical protein